MKKILIIILFFNSYSVLAQNWDETKTDFLVNLSNYRTKLISKNQSSLEQLNTLDEKWKEVETDKKLADKVLSNLHHSISSDIGFKSTKKKLSKLFPISKIVALLTEDDYHLIKQNLELIDLLDEEILEKTYPYPIKKDSDIWNELKFYNIKDNDTIGEIGAGNGSYALLIYLTNPNISLFINEKDYLLYDNIRNKIDSIQTYFQVDNIEAIKGSNKSTNFTQKLDKIIIKNTFHHFKYKEEMLARIYNDLKNGGYLYLYESPIGEKFPEPDCEFQMTKTAISDYMSTAGFKLVDELQFKDHIIFKYKK